MVLPELVPGRRVRTLFTRKDFRDQAHCQYKTSALGAFIPYKARTINTMRTTGAIRCNGASVLFHKDFQHIKHSLINRYATANIET
jgi:hypothetical protein